MIYDLSEIKISPREMQVLKLLANGLTCKEIAVLMGICDTTVITYKNL